MSFISAPHSRHAAVHRPTPPPGAAAAPASTDARAIALWRVRLDALTHWCLADLPLTRGAAACAPGRRDTLGDLLRRALAHAGDGVVDLLDALDDLDTPAARARVTRVLGGDALLVVATFRTGTMVRADVRACRTPDEAQSLVSAFLGTAPDVATLGFWTDGQTAGALVDDGLLRDGIAAPSRQVGGEDGECTLVLPFLTLDAVGALPVGLHPVAAPPAPAFPTVLGGVLHHGAAFLGTTPLDAVVAAPSDADESRETAVVAGQDEADDEDDVWDWGDGDAHAVTHSSHASGRDGVSPGVAMVEGRGEVPRAESAPEHVVDPETSRLLLDRVRARAASVDRVSAAIATDDGGAEHVCDVTDWLAEAGEGELRALIVQGWSGDAGVELAEALADDDPEVADVLRHARRHDAGVTVEVDERQAVAWLARHRPDVAERLDLA